MIVMKMEIQLLYNLLVILGAGNATTDGTTINYTPPTGVPLTETITYIHLMEMEVLVVEL